MDQRKPLLRQIADLAVILLGVVCLVVILSVLYTVIVVNSAEKSREMPPRRTACAPTSPKAMSRSTICTIIHAGTNSFDGSDPHIWYVIACVWGGHRADDGLPTGHGGRHAYDQPGLFFVETRKGWVYMSEGLFPTVVGFWMKVFGLAGPGSPVPSTDWGSTPDRGCKF